MTTVAATKAGRVDPAVVVILAGVAAVWLAAMLGVRELVRRRERASLP